MLPRRSFLFKSLALTALESAPAKAAPYCSTHVQSSSHLDGGRTRGSPNLYHSRQQCAPNPARWHNHDGRCWCYLRQFAYLSDPLPSGQRRPGEWIGRYAKRRLDTSGPSGIDTFLLTHLHGDHVGYVPPNGPLSSRVGKSVERFRSGSKDQFALRHKAADYPSFEIRSLIANGEVWTGKGEETRKLFPEISTLKAVDYPAENPCSCAVRVRYGKFGYYTGGDLTNDTNYGRDPWRDTESPAAEVCGPVSVAVANHHGYFNANGDRFVRAMQPQVFVVPTWDSAHPTVNVLNTLYSKAIYSGDRDVFATSVKQENRIANKKTDDLKSRAGHIVTRVEPGGGTFAVHILSKNDESDMITASFGPYAS